MFQLFTKKVCTAFLLATSAATVSAQVYQPSVAYEFTYGNSGIKFPQSTSCHSMPAGGAYFPSLGLGSTDLYVAAWNDPEPGRLSEVTVMLTPPNDPTIIYWQGSIMYTDVIGLEVGSIRNPATNETNILVAYYRNGDGYYLDEYKLGPGGATGLVNQTYLAASPTYGRIRMDFHSLWSGAIAWINTDPAVNRVQTMVYQNSAWSGTSTISNAANKTDLDLALEVVEVPTGSSFMELHLVYAGSGLITKSSLNFNTLATTPGTYAATFNHSVFVSVPISRLSLDCPGFTVNSSRWAYTYSDLANVVVYFRDPAVAGGLTQTAITTAGTLGNVPIAGSYKMYSPSLNYELDYASSGTYQNEIMVAWYATDGAGFNKYIGLKMDPTGTYVSSLGDYLDLPNAQTPTSPVPFSSGIMLNKTDLKTRSPFSYATYFDIDPVTGLYQLHHAFHKWGDAAFRGLPEEATPGQGLSAGTRISSYPNPFSQQLNVSLEIPQNSIVELLLTDISGRTTAHTNYALTKGSHQVKLDQLSQLAPGNYLLTVLIDHKKAAVQKITKQ